MRAQDPSCFGYSLLIPLFLFFLASPSRKPNARNLIDILQRVSPKTTTTTTTTTEKEYNLPLTTIIVLVGVYRPLWRTRGGLFRALRNARLPYRVANRFR